jgi:adenine-specific DNA-methyltransferase
VGKILLNSKVGDWAMARRDYSSWSQEELIEEINQLNSRKRFGLVWEERPEDAAAELATVFPLMTLDTKRRIGSDADAPNLLIEGDNLFSLTALTYTHEGQVDVIYIDPPYNRGSNDFKYNDDYVNPEDTFRHSNWLSFMHKRLRLARQLLADNGVIAISIDDNEQANLKLLCDEIFLPQNFLGCLPTIMNLKGNQDQTGFAGTHEYTLVYAKDKPSMSLGAFDVDEEALEEEWQQDETGWWKQGAGLKSTGKNGPREKRPNLFYPLYVKKDGSEVTPDKQAGYDEVLPITDGREMTWRWQSSTARELSSDLIANGTSPNWTIYKKQRPELGDLPSKKPKSILYKPKYSTTNGTNELKTILGERAFDYPKPVELVHDLVKIASSKKDALVLDFFAGSGTTGQAVLTLNARDGGNRRFILCTNNEEQIAEAVCYPRVKAVMTGYSDSKGRKVKGLGGSLQYLQVTSSPSAPTDANKKKIAQSATYLLCLKELCFDKVLEKETLKIFKSTNKAVLVVLDEESIQEAKSYVSTSGFPSVIYVFSLGGEMHEEEFAEFGDLVTVRPIPESILNSYMRARRSIERKS